MSKIRKGDQVQILAGKDRGKRGKIIRVNPKENKVFVEGLNLVKRHRRPKKGGEKGQRVEVPAAVSVSNVMIICTACGKPAKVGKKVLDSGKIRICRKCKNEIK